MLLGALARWVFKRAKRRPTARTPTVLRGRWSKTEALVAHLHVRRMNDDDVQSEVELVAHEARKLAREAIDVAGGAKLGTRYEAARRRLEKTEPALDAVYRALREVGQPDSTLRVIDLKLDELIAGRQARAKASV